MQVAIATRHGSISDEVRDYISGKSEKLLTYFERVTAIDVTVDFDHEKVGVEILVDAEHKHNFVSSAECDSSVAAFDQAMHKMEQQIRKYKEKLTDHRRDLPMNEIVREEAEET